MAAGETGQLFSEEVERAMQRVQGEGPQARRLEEGLAQRRAARRAGFGAEHGDEDSPRPSRTAPQGELVPDALAPGPRSLPADAPEPPAAEAPSASSCLPCEEAGTPATGPANDGQNVAPSAALPTAVGAVSSPGAGSPGAASAALAALEAAPRGETPPVELPQADRPGPTRARGPAAPAAPTGPDPAPLQRAEEILRQIKLHASPGVRRLTLDLDPADLGRLSIQLALRTGKVTAIVRAENPETLALLQEREAELMGLFDQRGLEPDSVRFELGFRSGRAGGPAPEPRPARSARRAAASFTASVPPDAARTPLPRLDTLA